MFPLRRQPTIALNEGPNRGHYSSGHPHVLRQRTHGPTTETGVRWHAPQFLGRTARSLAQSPTGPSLPMPPPPRAADRRPGCPASERSGPVTPSLNSQPSTLNQFRGILHCQPVAAPLASGGQGSALDPAGLATLHPPPFFLGLTPAQTRAKGLPTLQHAHHRRQRGASANQSLGPSTERNPPSLRQARRR
jgi:hypothetical protein